ANFPGEIGDVMFSPNFEALSRDERNTAGREFFEPLKPPIEIPARSELLNPRFWILLLGPPISVGVPMLLIAWIVLGFCRSEVTVPMPKNVSVGLPPIKGRVARVGQFPD